MDSAFKSILQIFNRVAFGPLGRPFQKLHVSFYSKISFDVFFDHLFYCHWLILVRLKMVSKISTLLVYLISSFNAILDIANLFKQMYPCIQKSSNDTRSLLYSA